MALTLAQYSKLPGVHDLPMQVRSPFIQALKAEDDGDHARAAQKLGSPSRRSRRPSRAPQSAGGSPCGTLERLRQYRRQATHEGSAMSNIAAYSERATSDPQTGEPGVLRQEWRILPIGHDGSGALWTYKRLADLSPYHGAGVTRYSAVMEHRYIRRGVEEPWTFFDADTSADSLLKHIDSGATAVDSRLAEIQQRRRLEAIEEQGRREQADRDERTKQAQQDLRERSDAAFVRMRNGSAAGCALADSWHAFVTATAGTPRAEQLRRCDEFMAAYAAVLDAVTVPAKRKAIKAALALAAHVEG